MNLLRVALHRMQHALPKSWQRRWAPLTCPSSDQLPGGSVKSSPQPFCTARFPAIDWTEADRLVAQGDPLWAVDRALHSSPRYGVFELPESMGVSLVNNASHASLVQRLAPNDLYGDGPSPR